MLGRARRGRSVAVAAVHGGVDGALASGPVDHPIPNILVPLETVRDGRSRRCTSCEVKSSCAKVAQELSCLPVHVYILGTYSLNKTANRHSMANAFVQNL